MTLRAQLYFSFRSPYSYLATPKLHQLTQDFDLAIDVRPVYPIAIRDPDFFQRENANWVPYLLQDVRRVAQFEDLPFGFPKPDPIVQDRETRKIAAEQPYIHNITWLGIAAAQRGATPGMTFILHVSNALWGERVENWHLPENLARIVQRAGLDLAKLQAEIDGNEDRFNKAVEANQAALEAAGHWGVPTLVFDGEPFFGQDRIDLAIWRMKQAGLQPRA